MDTPISRDLFFDFLQCKYKAYRKLEGESGPQSDYDRLQVRLANDYRSRAEEHLLQFYCTAETSQSPDSLAAAMKHGYALITNVIASVGNMSMHFDALLRTTKRTSSLVSAYTPVLFLYTEKISKPDKLLLAYSGLILGRLQGRDVTFGRTVRGEQFALSKMRLTKLFPTVDQVVQELTDVGSGNTVPSLRLNEHCSLCEFKEQCHATAVERDDLSLLRGLSDKEVSKINKRGIFTVHSTPTRFDYGNDASSQLKAWSATTTPSRRAPFATTWFMSLTSPIFHLAIPESTSMSRVFLIATSITLLASKYLMALRDAPTRSGRIA
jgi:predicted RecB family nuclease